MSKVKLNATNFLTIWVLHNVQQTTYILENGSLKVLLPLCQLQLHAKSAQWKCIFIALLLLIFIVLLLLSFTLSLSLSLYIYKGGWRKFVTSSGSPWYDLQGWLGNKTQLLLTVTLGIPWINSGTTCTKSMAILSKAKLHGSTCEIMYAWLSPPPPQKVTLNCLLRSSQILIPTLSSLRKCARLPKEDTRTHFPASPIQNLMRSTSWQHLARRELELWPSFLQFPRTYEWAKCQNPT